MIDFEIKRAVKVPAKEFDRVMAVLKWYGEMPDEYIIDSLDENVFELIWRLLPELVELEDHTHYCESPYIEDGRLFVGLVSMDDEYSLTDFVVEFVKE